MTSIDAKWWKEPKRSFGQDALNLDPSIKYGIYKSDPPDSILTCLF